jgi:exodeoxyribonuclease-3
LAYSIALGLTTLYDRSRQKFPKMRIATWNINGIRARLDGALTWVRDANPDILCFQEIKTQNDGFPSSAFEDLGYNIAVHGQKGFNGVAILSKMPLEDVARGLPGNDGDDHARFISAAVSVPSGVVRVACLYLPNGNPVGSEKFDYKLGWMARLEAWARKALAGEEPLVMCGDYNIIPEPIDARDPNLWTRDALFQPESRGAFRRLVNLGFTDAIRATHAEPGDYTFWDYQAGAWQKNNGIRIDHMLLSPQAADRLRQASIDKRTRGFDKPSDHVPVMVELDV